MQARTYMPLSETTTAGPKKNSTFFILSEQPFESSSYENWTMYVIYCKGWTRFRTIISSHAWTTVHRDKVNDHVSKFHYDSKFLDADTPLTHKLMEASRDLRAH